MTDTEKRISIAEACGWKATPNTWYSPNDSSYARYKLVGSEGRIEIPDENILPDYLNDLNAMHEAERKQIRCSVHNDNYLRNLHNICSHVGTSIAFATAGQRSDAFLKTIGLLK